MVNRHILKLILILAPMLSHASREEDMMENVRALVDQKGIDYYIEEVVRLSQSEFPKTMNRLDTVTSMYYLKADKALVYNHLLSRDWKSQITQQTGVSGADIERHISGLMQRQAIARVCSFALNRFYFEHGVKLLGLYADYSGAVVFRTSVSAKDCDD